MQFGDDWPGVFIRGDNAAAHQLTLAHAIQELKSNPSGRFLVLQLRSLAELLGKSNMHGESFAAGKVQYMKPIEQARKDA